jgi:hypothetical protein
MRHIIVDSTLISNPGTELANVARWYLEVNERGYPVREVALGSDGAPLRVSPQGRDRGVWCDSSCLFIGPEWEEISPAEFERKWSAANVD